MVLLARMIVMIMWDALVWAASLPLRIVIVLLRHLILMVKNILMLRP